MPTAKQIEIKQTDPKKYSIDSQYYTESTMPKNDQSCGLVGLISIISFFGGHQGILRKWGADIFSQPENLRMKFLVWVQSFFKLIQYQFDI